MPSTTKFDELIGQVLDDYHIQKVLGVGGQAVVFQAESITLHRTMALKVFGLTPSQFSPTDAGLTEARRQASINHRAIIAIHTPGIEDVQFAGEQLRVLYIPALPERGD